MNTKKIILVLLTVLFTSCSLNHPVERVLAVSGDMYSYTSGNTLKLYTFVGDTITFNYQFYPNESYNCQSFDVKFSTEGIFELIESDIEHKQFKVKSLKRGTSNVIMTPYPNPKEQSSTMQIEVR